MSDRQVKPPKEATTATQNRNRDVLTSLPFGDTLDFDDASRGFIASLPDVEIRNDRGHVVWSLRDYAFLAHEADVAAGHVAVIAPDRFLEEVTQEQVLVGGPMVRRAQFQFGATLFKGPRGQVDAGLGKVTSRGTVTLIAPTGRLTTHI